MYKICQSEQSSHRQRELEMGLLQLMLKRHYEDITVSDLCEHMSIPRKSFYRYFSSKDGALFALLDHTLAEFFDIPPERHSAKHGTAMGDLDLFFLFWYQRRSLLDALIHSSLSGLLIERAHAFAMREGHVPHYIKRWTTEMQGLALAFCICGLMSMILQWHRQNYQTSVEDMTQLAASMLTQPLVQ